MLNRSTSCLMLAAFGLAAAAGPETARAQVAFGEVEPNSNKSQATPVIGMASNDFIIGVTTGAVTSGNTPNTIDYFRVQTAPLSLGIYRHRLIITTGGTQGHIGTLRGLTQTNHVINPGTDPLLQNSSATTAPPRFNQWYGFGRQEQVYWAVSGTASTNTSYTATLQSVPISPVSVVGSVSSGNVTISRAPGNTTDIDFWVYDNTLHPIATFGNDGPDTLTRAFNPGTYFLAISNFNFANDQPAPADDTFATGNVLDFPDIAVNNGTATGINLGFRITHSGGTIDTAATKSEPYQVLWFAFTVFGGVPTNPSGTGAASPASVPSSGGTTVLTVSVTPGANPASTGLGVSVSAGSIGAGTVFLHDDGVAPDVTANDNVFAGSASVAPGTAPGNYNLPFTITDSQGRSGSGGIALNVFGPASNDECATAISLGGGGSFPWDDTGGTTGAGQPAGCVPVQRDIWYTFTSPGFGRLTIDTITPDGPGVVADTVLAVYRGGSCPGTLAGCDDDSGGQFKSRVANITCSPGEAFRIQVGSYSESVGGSGVLNIGFSPFNGACCQGSQGCSIQTPAACAGMGGTYVGNDTTCTGPDTYTVAVTPVPLEDISATGTTAALTDDSSVLVSLPFTFNFYGVPKSSVNICSNGFLSFGTAGLTTTVNSAIPSSAAPNDAIYGLWDDLNPEQGGSIKYEVRGVAPSRRFIVQWTAVPQFNTGDSNTFQIVLFEDSHIAFRYGLITAETPAGDYTIGVENAAGTVATTVSSAAIGTGNTSRILTYVPPSPTCPTTCVVSAPAYPTGGLPGQPILISVRVPALCQSSIVSVTANLSSLGGPSNFQLFDDRSQGDAVDTDGIYSRGFVLPGFVPTGPLTIQHTVNQTGGFSETVGGSYTIIDPPACTTTFLNNISPGGLTQDFDPPELVSQIRRCDGCETNPPGVAAAVSGMVDDLELDGLEGGAGPTIQCVEAVMRFDAPGSPRAFRVNLFNTLGAAQMLQVGNQYREEFLTPTQVIHNFDPSNYQGFDLVRFVLGSGYHQSGTRVNLAPGTYYISVLAISSTSDGNAVVALTNDPNGNFNGFRADIIPGPPSVFTPPPSNGGYRVKGLGLIPDCMADINGDGVLNPDDLSDYIACYFNIPPCSFADFNNDGTVNPDDLSDYIGSYFGGCP